MRVVSEFLSYLLPVFYLAVVYVYYNIFFGKRKKLGTYTPYFLTGLLVLHVLEMGIRLFFLNAMPLSTAFDALSFLAFSILTVYFIIELTIRNKASGLFILSFAFLAELVSAFNHSWKIQTSELLSKQTFAIHASITIMGYTALSLSAIYALMYVIQNRNMKKRRFNIIYDQLPALTYLEMMSIRSVFIGIILMGLGVMMGHIQTYLVFGKLWIPDAKVIITDIIWFLYFAGYVGARLYRWRGRWMAWLSLSGFFILLAGGLLVVLLTESFHKFY